MRLKKATLSAFAIALMVLTIAVIVPTTHIHAQVNRFFTALPTATGVTSYKETESGNGAMHIVGSNSELITLSTGSVNSASVSTQLLPANSIIRSVTGVVTTAITGGCTGWSIDDGTTATRFTANNTTLTAGTTSIGLNQWSGAVTTLAAGPTQAAASGVRIVCAGAAASAGAIRVTVTYDQVIPDFQ